MQTLRVYRKPRVCNFVFFKVLFFSNTNIHILIIQLQYCWLNRFANFFFFLFVFIIFSNLFFLVQRNERIWSFPRIWENEAEVGKMIYN